MRRRGPIPRALRALAFGVSLLVASCSSETNVEPAAGAPSPTASPPISSAARLRAADPRPSVLLVVLDTLRADAVSAYGAVDGTTPNLDRLAREGLRYERALAPAPWTVSSHVSLFTGLRVDEHGVGLAGAAVAPDSLRMLSEVFADAGYVTAGFAENSLVSPYFGFDQGFERFDARDIVEEMRAAGRGSYEDTFDVVERFREWNRERDKSRPYFAFVNLLDPHDPYLVRDENPWLPEGVDRDEARFVESSYTITYALCDGAPTREHAGILRGLYLGDVAAADAKLGRLLEILDAEDEPAPPLSIVTSDHGEHLGENRLMGHQFSVRHPVLHIPLVVSGLRDVEPAVIEAPVELRSVHDSVLCWALGESCDSALPTKPTSTTTPGATDEPIFGIYSDSISRLPDWLVDQFGIPDHRERVDPARLKCGAEDRVFGDMVSMTRYPMKITWFEQGDPVLHDLSWDPAERSDQMKGQPELAASMLAELEAFVEANVRNRERTEAPELSEEGVEALKALGYIR